MEFPKLELLNVISEVLIVLGKLLLILSETGVLDKNPHVHKR